MCQVDNECAFNEKCVQGNCLLTCRLDNDCFLGHICLHNLCTFGCRADEDCNANEACLGNKCANPCEVTPCGPNSKCTVINQRASCSCPPDFIPNPSAKVACLRSPGPSCQANRDCLQGTACMSGICTPVCSSNANCLSNERCDSLGVCRSLCRRDEDCQSGEICEGLVCLSGCRADVECQENLACINNQCIGKLFIDYCVHAFLANVRKVENSVINTYLNLYYFSDPCSLPNACGINAQCSVVNHWKQCSCPDSLIGDPLINCRQSFLPCSSASECLPGQTCYGRSCYSTCRRYVLKLGIKNLSIISVKECMRLFVNL